MPPTVATESVTRYTCPATETRASTAFSEFRYICSFWLNRTFESARSESIFLAPPQLLIVFRRRWTYFFGSRT